MDGQINEVRRVLETYDRSAVTLHWLAGTIETTDFADTCRTFDDDGDRALVVLGPKDKLQVERREEEDGSIVYSFRFPPPIT